ncbi:uncharacterized protein GIQ15_03977 [Arthroderma uncinatum]|uniref:uncharacterized protein n=1 Tax=Arthroderma uncinatum TaxID=74035 RepID=UPI00144AE5AE|nr:uncharacterized protein GIQ15_03977 [Arthroderma uncinatum]KAF3481218.1 hypothetical protein GIQ15_03977 [Arthroderma uncinatum]
MEETPPEILSDLSETVITSKAAGIPGQAENANKPEFPVQVNLSPIAKRAWSLASEATGRLQCFQRRAERWFHDASAAGVDWRKREIYLEEATRVEQRWMLLLAKFKLYKETEASLRPIESKLNTSYARHILAFRRAVFVNRYRIIFERLNLRGSMNVSPDLDKTVADQISMWTSFEERIRGEQKAAYHPQSGGPAASKAFAQVCKQLGIDWYQSMETVLGFGRRGMLPPDILSYIEHGQLHLVRHYITSDVRDFPFLYFPADIEYTRRLLIANTLLRLLRRWYPPGPNQNEPGPQFYEDKRRLNSGGVIGTYTAREQIADEIAMQLSSSEYQDRVEMLFSHLLSRRLMIVKEVERNELYHVAWLRRSAERHLLLSEELGMMMDLIRGDQAVGKSQFGSYGEHVVPLDTFYGASPVG